MLLQLHTISLLLQLIAEVWIDEGCKTVSANLENRTSALTRQWIARSRIWTTISRLPRVLYFGPKTLFIPPPLWKWYFPPSLTRRFLTLLWPFCPNSTLFAFYSPFTSPFLIFFPHTSFSFTFSSLFSSTFHTFPPNDISWYLCTPRGEGYFPIHRPLE